MFRLELPIYPLLVGDSSTSFVMRYVLRALLFFVSYKQEVLRLVDCSYFRVSDIEVRFLILSGVTRDNW